MNSTPIQEESARRGWSSWDINRLPWWAVILAFLGILFVFLLVSSSDYMTTFIYLQVGVLTTLRITLFAFPIATVIGLIVGLARTSKNPVLFNLATLYVEVIRGIPLIVIILYIAFGLVPAAVELIQRIPAFSTFSIRSISTELRAIIALAIGYGAYEAEIFRAGIQSIARGQMEAARSLGMSYGQSMRYIILPQAVRRVLPPLGNDFIALLKDSSLATVLAVPELTQLGRLRRASTFRYLETFNVVAFLYLSMTLLLSAFVRAMERYLKYEE